MWWTLFIIFLLVSIFSSITLYYALKRINQYENFIIDFQKIIKIASVRVKRLDDKGSFESDDEIGFFFNEVKSLQSMLDNIFEEEVNDNLGENDDKEDE
tara:strand:+ start:1229 stop:1525 length:297 start_codon:yes stop_codon:yes gene_type:complete